MDDIYIHGPSADGPEKKEEKNLSTSLTSPQNLLETNPLQDLSLLIRKPSDFFKYFKGSPSKIDISNWIWTKAFLTFFFFHWLASFKSSTSAWDNFEHSVDGVLGSSSRDSLFSLLGPDLGPLREKAGLVFLFFQQAGIFSAPLIALVSLLGFALVSHWGLKLFGVSEDKISFKGIFISGLYAKSFIGFSVFPIFGSLFAAILPIFYYLKALQVLSDESALRVFLASYGLNTLIWLLFFFGVALIALVFVGSLGSMIRS